MSGVELTFVILGGIGSFLSGIIVLITFIRIITKFTLKPEVIYGGEAEKRFENLENKELKPKDEIASYPYEGGKSKIVPRLEIEKCNYNPLLMEEKFEKCRQRVRYIDRNRKVRTWYIK